MDTQHVTIYVTYDIHSEVWAFHLFGFLVMVLFGIYGILFWVCSFGSFVFFVGSGLGELAPPADLLDKQILIL